MRREGVKVLRLRSLLFLPLLAFPIQAQSFRPQFPQQERIARFRWEGVVDGTSVIRIRRRQVSVEHLSGLPVQRQRYDFTDPLPSSRVEVELEVIEGRGRVRLVEQPRANNDYVAAVRIEDPDRGQGRYAFELRWQDRDWRGDDDWPRPRPRDVESFAWRGRVDDESIIRVRGEQVWVENLSGYGVSGERYRFSSPLPMRPLQVNLVDAEGRGEVVIIEQPGRDNDYTAAVRIRDRQSGASAYAFTLTWTRRGWQDRPRDPDDRGGARRGLRWSGRVDGRDLLRLRGDQLWVEHQAGLPIAGADYRFLSPLPAERRTVTVSKLRGRGTVRVLEQPARHNDFTATILIEDRDGGSDQYEIEVVW
jgi:hypothetical protein